MHALQITFSLLIARVTSYFLHMSYELLLIARVTSQSYIGVTSYYLLHELRVNSNIRVTSYYTLHKFYNSNPSGHWSFLIKINLENDTIAVRNLARS